MICGGGSAGRAQGAGRRHGRRTQGAGHRAQTRAQDAGRRAQGADTGASKPARCPLSPIIKDNCHLYKTDVP